VEQKANEFDKERDQFSQLKVQPEGSGTKDSNAQPLTSFSSKFLIQELAGQKQARNIYLLVIINQATKKIINQSGLARSIDKRSQKSRTN
jgi:hypothetical protein